MKKKQLNWVRQPQEQEGDYHFDGQFVVTCGIDSLLSKVEIHAIYFHIRALVEQYGGLDYLQVFIHKETEQKLFFIDQLSVEMKKNHPKEHNYCTLMLAEEY